MQMAATFERPSVTAELARAMIVAAEQKAAQMGHAFAIAVVDDSGVLKAFSRMDGAPLLAVQVACTGVLSWLGPDPMTPNCAYCQTILPC